MFDIRVVSFCRFLVKQYGHVCLYPSKHMPWTFPPKTIVCCNLQKDGQGLKPGSFAQDIIYPILEVLWTYFGGSWCSDLNTLAEIHMDSKYNWCATFFEEWVPTTKGFWGFRPRFRPYLIRSTSNDRRARLVFVMPTLYRRRIGTLVQILDEVKNLITGNVDNRTYSGFLRRFWEQYVRLAVDIVSSNARQSKA